MPHCIAWSVQSLCGLALPSYRWNWWCQVLLDQLLSTTFNAGIAKRSCMGWFFILLVLRVCARRMPRLARASLLPDVQSSVSEVYIHFVDWLSSARCHMFTGQPFGQQFLPCTPKYPKLLFIAGSSFVGVALVTWVASGLI